MRKKSKIKILNPILASLQSNLLDLISPIQTQNKNTKNKVFKIEKKLGIKRIKFKNKKNKVSEEYRNIKNIIGHSAKGNLLNQIQKDLILNSQKNELKTEDYQKNKNILVKNFEEELGIKNVIEEKTDKVREEVKDKARVYQEELHNLEILSHNLIESKIKKIKEEIKLDFKLFEEEIGVNNFLELPYYINKLNPEQKRIIEKEFRNFEEELGIKNVIEEKALEIKEEIKDDFRIFEEKIIDVENNTKKTASDKINSVQEEIHNEIKKFEKELITVKNLARIKTSFNEDKKSVFSATNISNIPKENINNELIKAGIDIKETLSNQLSQIRNDLNKVNCQTKLKNDVYRLENDIYNISNDIKNTIQEKIRKVKEDIGSIINKFEEEITSTKNSIKNIIVINSNKIKKYSHELNIQNRIKNEFYKIEENMQNKLQNLQDKKTEEKTKEDKQEVKEVNGELSNKIKNEVKKFEEEIIKVGENIKRAFKKKEKLSEKDELRLTAYHKIAVINVNKNIDEAFKDFSWYIKVFVQHYFSIRYEFTSDELKTELEKRKINNNLKNVVISVFQYIEQIKYLGNKLNSKELINIIKKSLIMLKSLK